MIDTNIRRILTRVFWKNKKVPTDKELYAFASALIPKEKGREWNYAMLDLGATACTARNHSPECPLRELHGKVGDFIYKKPQKKFAGSERFYRGNVLRFLAKERQATLVQLKNELVGHETPFALLNKLTKEGLILKNKAKYSLP
jgi:adenine-specific DNA glycosylase